MNSDRSQSKERATPGEGSPGHEPALNRAVKMIELGRNGQMISFQNDEIEALLCALTKG